MNKWIIACLLIANVMCSLIICIKNTTINKVKHRISGLYQEKINIIDSVYVLRQNDTYLQKLSSNFNILKALSYDIPDITSLSQILNKELNISFDSTELQKVYELSPKLCLDRLLYDAEYSYFNRGYDIGLHLNKYYGILAIGKCPYLIHNFSPQEATLSINGKNYWWSAESIWYNEKLKIPKVDFKNLNKARCYFKVNAISERLLESKIVWVKDDGILVSE